LQLIETIHYVVTKGWVFAFNMGVVFSAFSVHWNNIFLLCTSLHGVWHELLFVVSQTAGKELYIHTISFKVTHIFIY